MNFNKLINSLLKEDERKGYRNAGERDFERWYGVYKAR
jgi:hypothetical protein